MTHNTNNLESANFPNNRFLLFKLSRGKFFCSDELVKIWLRIDQYGYISTANSCILALCLRKPLEVTRHAKNKETATGVVAVSEGRLRKSMCGWRGSDDRSLSGMRSTVDTPGVTLQQYAPGATATTAHARNVTLQTYPGAPFNRTNWHPNDHRSPLQLVYTPILYSPLRRASFSI